MIEPIERSAWRRLLQHRGGQWGLAIITGLVLLALFAPLISRYSPTDQPDIVGLANHPPSLAHPFGTDEASRDVLARVLYGARISLSVGMLSVLVSATLGTAFGLIAGFAGGRTEALMMRVLDACLSLPRVLVLIAILAVWSSVPVTGLVLIIGLTGWFGVSRLVRAEVRSARNSEYVTAARAMGASPSRIIVRHLLPNVSGPILVSSALAVGNVIVLEAGLAFLGVGVKEPIPSWGSIFLESGSGITQNWWIALFPGLAIVITVLAFNMLADALRDVLDPRQLAGP